jgi:hypothetical protein
MKYNYSIKWAGDESNLVRDSHLDLKNYQGGDDAPVGSWVLLGKKGMRS